MQVANIVKNITVDDKNKTVEEIKKDHAIHFVHYRDLYDEKALE